MLDPRLTWAAASGPHPPWRILVAGLRQAQPFLRAWQAWRLAHGDPHRPGLLQVVAIEPWPVTAAELLRDAPADLEPLARELAAQWWGLTPGVHRLSFEGGRVQLTLCVGEVHDMLREFSFAADAVLLHERALDLAALKSVARLCRRGTRIAVLGNTASPQDLATCGFRGDLYDPAWTPRHPPAPAPVAPGNAIVIGAGLAGASAAAALAQRGWQVQVLDAAPAPAAGASGLPAGLMAPHLSPDDNLLSRLSRAGIRITLQHARALLREGEDWQGGGTLEHRLRPNARPLQAEGFAADWSRAATPDERQAAFLPDGAPAAWHGPAGWIRPGALVRAWLDHPAIAFHGGVRVQRLARQGNGDWRLYDEADQPIAQAPLVVIAAALGSMPLAGHRLWLNPVRGQVSWGPHAPAQCLPPFPVNGNGHLLPDVPLPGGRGWMIGSSYGRGETDLTERPADHLANLERLRALAPLTAQQLAPAFATGQVRGWTGVRCASTDRRPLVGPLDPSPGGGLWVSTALGSRGLSFAALCAQVLVARLHADPLPLPASLAAALDVARQLRPAPLSGNPG